MIRIGVAGTGSMGRTHALALATIPDATVAAVFDDNPEHAAQLAASVGARPYTDLATMLAAESLDAVDCCLPTPLHRPDGGARAAAGCHVICEKPMAHSLADGQAMIAACRAAGRHLLMAQVVRFFPEYRRLAMALQEGRIGKPVSLTTLRQSAYPTGRRGWFRDESMSGGVLLDQMIHDFDWALAATWPGAARLCPPGAALGATPLRAGHGHGATYLRRDQPDYRHLGPSRAIHHHGRTGR